MRIVYLVNAPRQHLTGAAVRALTLAGAALDRGDAAVVIGPGGSALERAARERGIAFSPADFSATIASWWRLRRILAEKAPDVIHAMSTVPMVLASPGLLLGRTRGGREGGRAVARFVSVVVDPRSSLVFADGRPHPTATARRNRLLARISPALDGVFAISAPVRATLLALGVSDPIVLGGAAIDVESLTERALDTIALPCGRPRIGSAVGQLESLKGVDVLLRAFVPVLAEYPDAICLVGGEGSQRQALEHLAGELGIASRVHLLGYLDEPAPLLGTLDIHVSPSLSEGLGSATAQAMALGVPSIATDVGGASDVIADGVNGVLVPAADVNALASAMLGLLGDPQRAREIADRGRESVIEHHGAAEFIDATWAQYERTLGISRSGR